MQITKADKTVREMLVGHSTGLDKAYYKSHNEVFLQECLKVVNLPTVNKEHKLQTQLDYYKQREDKLVNISLKLQERDEGTKKLKEPHQNDIKLFGRIDQFCWTKWTILQVSCSSMYCIIIIFIMRLLSLTFS